MAAASLNFDPVVSEFAEALNTGREIKKEEVRFVKKHSKIFKAKYLKLLSSGTGFMKQI